MINKRKGPLKLKQWTFTFVSLIPLAIILILPQTASAISIKETSVIDKDTLTLGDVFSGLEYNADKVLGAAPQPGSDMVLNSRTLMRIAIAMNLPWRPATTADQVTIRRAATVIDRPLIEEAIKNEISAQGISGQYNIVFNGEIAKIVLPQNENQSVEILSFSINPEKNLFTAELAAPSKNNPIKQTTVKGRLERMIEIPVLAETLQAGQVINKNDLTTLLISADKVQNDVIINKDNLIGMTPRRLALVGKPLKSIDVEAPQIVSRGELVTMVFSNGGLSLTSQGKALQDGAKGDVIRVVNASSNQTIQGRITGIKEITVDSF